MFKNARVLAGHSGLGHPVNSINMMDAPDIVDFLKQDELLLTTAYALKDNVDELEKLVEGMAKQGCAGLGIKTKRFLLEIPTSLLQIAEELHFPIIDLPTEHSLGEMLTHALSFILEKHTRELRHTVEAHREFTTLLINGGGISDILKKLESLLQVPVAVFDSNAQSMAASTKFTHSKVDRACRMIERWLCDTSGWDATPIQVCSWNDAIPAQFLWLIPVKMPLNQGFLCLIGEVLANDPLSQLTIEQAINVISFEMMKQQAVKERSRRYKNEFFTQFLEGKLSSEREVIQRGREFGLQVHKAYRGIVVKLDNAIHSIKHYASPPDLTDRDQVYELIKFELRRRGLDYVIGAMNDHVVVILYSESATEPQLQHVRELIQDIQTEMMKRAPVSPSFGIGNQVLRLMDIPFSYNKAIQALQAGLRSKKRQFIQDYQIIDIADLWRAVPQQDLLYFYEAVLGALKDLEPQERDSLTKTLYAYLDNSHSISETAKALFVHRNTVLYRLQKFEELSGRNLKESGETLRIHVALSIAPLLT